MPRAPEPTDDFRRSVEQAIRLAQQNGAPFVGTEHLLLGALRQVDTPAVRLLVSRGITWQNAERQYLTRFVPTYRSSAAKSVPSRETLTPLTPRANDVVQVCLRTSHCAPSARDLLVALLQERGLSEGLLVADARARGLPPPDVAELVRALSALESEA